MFKSLERFPDANPEALNQQNYEILKVAEIDIRRELAALTEAMDTLDARSEPFKAAKRTARGLGIELVRVRQMMRAETKDPNPHFRFEDVDLAPFPSKFDD